MFKFLLVFLTGFNSCIAVAGPDIDGKGIAREVGHDLETGKAIERTQAALDAIMIVAVKTLERKGHPERADVLKRQWAIEKTFILAKGFKQWATEGAKGFGDHERIEWLFRTWEMLDGLLGSQVMALTHLDDLYIFAYGIPVCLWCVDQVDAEEYAIHFYGYKGGFSGALTYWSAQITCSALTFGSGWGFVCGPVATVAENFMVAFIAPGLSPRVHKLACDREDVVFEE